MKLSAAFNSPKRAKTSLTFLRNSFLKTFRSRASSASESVMFLSTLTWSSVQDLIVGQVLAKKRRFPKSCFVVLTTKTRFFIGLSYFDVSFIECFLFLLSSITTIVAKWGICNVETGWKQDRGKSILHSSYSNVLTWDCVYAY